MFAQWNRAYSTCIIYSILMGSWANDSSTIRILTMVPVFAIVGLLSIRNYTHALYYQVAYMVWEAFAISSFYRMCCTYLDVERKNYRFGGYFRVAWPPSAPSHPREWINNCILCPDIFSRPKFVEHQWNVLYVGVYQYCFLRPVMGIVTVVAQACDRYCEERYCLQFAHIYVGQQTTLLSDLANSDERKRSCAYPLLFLHRSVSCDSSTTCAKRTQNVRG